MKCVFCGRNAVYREIYVTLQPGSIRAKAWKCMSCKEYYMESGAAQQSLLLNQLQRGIQVKIGQLGNSGFFRFPADVMRLFKLKKGQEVTARVVSNKGKFVLEITPN